MKISGNENQTTEEGTHDKAYRCMKAVLHELFIEPIRRSAPLQVYCDTPGQKVRAPRHMVAKPVEVLGTVIVIAVARRSVGTRATIDSAVVGPSLGQC